MVGGDDFAANSDAPPANQPLPAGNDGKSASPSSPGGASPGTQPEKCEPLWKTPGSVTSDPTPENPGRPRWSNTPGAQRNNDGAIASVSLSNYKGSERLYARDFGFAIPANARIV